MLAFRLLTVCDASSGRNVLSYLADLLGSLCMSTVVWKQCGSKVMILRWWTHAHSKKAYRKEQHTTCSFALGVTALHAWSGERCRVVVALRAMTKSQVGTARSCLSRLAPGFFASLQRGHSLLNYISSIVAVRAADARFDCLRAPRLLAQSRKHLDASGAAQ
jgi:hypothetical protein